MPSSLGGQLLEKMASEMDPSTDRTALDVLGHPFSTFAFRVSGDLEMLAMIKTP